MTCADVPSIRGNENAATTALSAVPGVFTVASERLWWWQLNAGNKGISMGFG